jgi:hypothetical protein
METITQTTEDFELLPGIPEKARAVLARARETSNTPAVKAAGNVLEQALADHDTIRGADDVLPVVAWITAGMASGARILEAQEGLFHAVREERGEVAAAYVKGTERSAAA